MPETYNEWLKNKEESWEREHPGWKPTCGGLESVTNPNPLLLRISGTVLAGFRECAGLNEDWVHYNDMSSDEKTSKSEGFNGEKSDSFG